MRTKDPQFLERLLESAAKVFAQKGLAKSRMSDIAQDMGVATGSLYNYVENKEALFFFLIDRGTDDSPIRLPAELPLPAPSPKAIEIRLKEQIAKHFALPELDRALKRRKVASVQRELVGILNELYERTAATRRVASAIERSAVDLPGMFALYFLDIRRTTLQKFSRYVQSRMKRGEFRLFQEPEIAARLMVETVIFAARHRHLDPDLPAWQEETIRKTTIEFLTGALLGHNDT